MNAHPEPWHPAVEVSLDSGSRPSARRGRSMDVARTLEHAVG